MNKYSSDTFRKLGEVLTNATTFRFDASDLMPPEVGAGSFWKEMTNLAVEGPGYIDTALSNVENSWP